MSISRESEFWTFMREHGPASDDSKSNYISWLNFVSETSGNIDNSITRDEIERICSMLRETRNQREKYQSNGAISDIKSALNKYLSFSEGQLSTSETTTEIIEILNQEVGATQKQEIDARIGQGKYRKELIDLWGMCSLTKYSRADFLIASHIKPWKYSSSIEKLDPYNGLLLTPNLDKLFDSGYISFDKKGNIIISKLLDDLDKKNMRVTDSMKLFKVHSENLSYLSYHRDSILLK